MNQLTRPSNDTLRRYFEGRSYPGERELIELYLAMGEDTLFVQECMDEAWQEIEMEGMAPADLQQAAWKKFIEIRKKTEQIEPGPHALTGAYTLRQWVRYAAAVLGLIALGTWTYKVMYRKDHSKEVVYTYYGAATGHGRQVALPDGSLAILFPGSSLRVPDNFGRKERRVLLAGKGYFNVRHNDDTPFYTEAAGLEIKDIGTSFQIDASETGPGRIWLKEGKIDVHYHQVPLAALLPGQRMAYDQHTTRWQVKSFDTAMAFSWLRGELNYDLSPLGEICADLQNWYGVRIHVLDEKLKRKRITAQFADIPIERIMDLLSKSSGFSYRKAGNEITIE